MSAILESLAVVLPRYGENLGGGAEALTKALIEHLAVELVGRIEVWTTCAVDHRTWENARPPGVTTEGAITVRRFPVDPRDLEAFIRAEMALSEGRRLSVEEQLDWLAASVNSSGLYRQLIAHGEEFTALLFAPYLFATSFWGSLIYPERSLIIPCLHNEHYAYQEIFRAQFAALRGVLFNSEPEAELARELYALADLAERSAVVGMGFEPKKRAAAPERPRPYLLYSGRKEQGKNLDLLIRCFAALGREDLELLIIGAGEITFLPELPPRVIDLGFVSEEEKRSLMAGAVALCQPSVNESFSIVLMEAWQEQTAVIVHGQCSVTRHHVVQSGGGLYFSDEAEFGAVVRVLLEQPALARRLGEAGARYVESEYSWPRVLERFSAALVKFGFTESEKEQAANDG